VFAFNAERTGKAERNLGHADWILDIAAHSQAIHRITANMAQRRSTSILNPPSAPINILWTIALLRESRDKFGQLNA
jgi:xanthine dehydrogenase molybdopterin-binding subunit B